MPIPLATVIFKRSGTHRNGNLKKGDGEAVKSGTEGMITFWSPSRNENEWVRVSQKSYHLPAPRKDPDHPSLVINFFIYRVWGWKIILHECACLYFWSSGAAREENRHCSSSCKLRHPKFARFSVQTQVTCVSWVLLNHKQVCEGTVFYSSCPL